MRIARGEKEGGEPEAGGGEAETQRECILYSQDVKHLSNGGDVFLVVVICKVWRELQDLRSKAVKE